MYVCVGKFEEMPESPYLFSDICVTLVSRLDKVPFDACITPIHVFDLQCIHYFLPFCFAVKSLSSHFRKKKCVEVFLVGVHIMAGFHIHELLESSLG